MAFTPTFYVRNRQGQYLARKVGDKHHLVQWVREREQAESFPVYSKALDFKMLLPVVVQGTAFISDQLGDRWTAQRAFNSGYMSARAVKQDA